MTPKTGSSELIQHDLKDGTYGYTAPDVNALEASEFTLVTIAVDESSSVIDFKDNLENMLKRIISACKGKPGQENPRVENVMVRIIAFSTNMREIHGYKMLSECNPDDYDGCIQIGGMTALFETTHNAISATLDFGKNMASNDYDVNAINFIITDGFENPSIATKTASQIKEVINKTRKGEELESIINVLIGIGTEADNDTNSELKDFNDEAGFDGYFATKDASASSIAQITNFASKSISSQSQALNSGAASQLLQF